MQLHARLELLARWQSISRVKELVRALNTHDAVDAQGKEEDEEQGDQQALHDGRSHEDIGRVSPRAWVAASLQLSCPAGLGLCSQHSQRWSSLRGSC